MRRIPVDADVGAEGTQRSFRGNDCRRGPSMVGATMSTPWSTPTWRSTSPMEGGMTHRWRC